MKYFLTSNINHVFHMWVVMTIHDNYNTLLT